MYFVWFSGKILVFNKFYCFYDVLMNVIKGLSVWLKEIKCNVSGWCDKGNVL